MKVLVLPANNAPDYHVNFLKKSLQEHGQEVVTWREGITKRDFDISIFVSGTHNSNLLHTIWNIYVSDEEFNYDDTEEDNVVRFGRGLYEFSNKFGSDIKHYLMIYPKDEIIQDKGNDVEEKYLAHRECYGPGFIRFDMSDTRHTGADYIENYGKLILDGIDDTVIYSFRGMFEREGFALPPKSPSTVDVKTTLYVCTEKGLLLLRRSR